MASTATGVLADRPPKIFSAVLLAGVVAGGLDALYAITYFGFTRGVQAYRTFQYIASGLLGPSSFSLGWRSVVLGVICHFAIAIGAAATYAVVASQIRGLIVRARVWGPIFGIGIYLVMNFVVVPLSRVTVRSGPPQKDVIVLGILVHMFLIGLPIAWIVSTALRRK